MLLLIRSVAPTLLALLPACLALVGCGHVDEIQHYQAIKLKQPEPPPFEEPPAVDRISAAIVVHPAGSPNASDKDSESPAAAWFFKLSGPVAAVDAQADAFEKFVSSIHFVDDAPKYDPPADWQPQGPSSMRYETFEIPGNVELSVSTLPKLEKDETAFLLNNINRWRGQLGLRDRRGSTCRHYAGGADGRRNRRAGKSGRKAQAGRHGFTSRPFFWSRRWQVTLWRVAV